MKKTAFFLVGDYWHHGDTIKPLQDILFPQEEWEVVFTEKPEDLLEMNSAPDLIISFKDPIENDQIPTPIWCDEKWTEYLLNCIRENGTGVLFVHAAVTDLNEKHPIVKDLIQSVFTGHPSPCRVSFMPIKDHIILKGIDVFTFPENDEHYMMSMVGKSDVEIIANTVSEHDSQPGMWVRELGRGRACCLTSGHTTQNLTCDGYIGVLKNAIKWCIRETCLH